MFVVHIHSKNGVPRTENAYAAHHGFTQLGCHVQLFETPAELRRHLGLGDCVVGYISDALLALEEMDQPRPVAIDYPAELGAFYGRRIWADTLAHVAGHPEHWPVFVKSTTQKGFTGRVIATTADLVGTAYQNQDRAVHCSDVVALVSEWRGFVRHGQLVDVRRYHGRWDVFPDPAVMRAALVAWKSRPAGGSIDFGVTADGRTVVVECNDGFALGHYGLDAVLYAKLISARWHELLGQPDPFRFLP